MTEQATGIKRMTVGRMVRKKLRRTRYKYISWNGLGLILWKVLRTVIIMGLCFVIIYPFFAKFMNTFKSVNDLYNTNLKYVPQHFTMEYFNKILKDMDYWKTALNTTLFCLTTSLLQTLMSALVAYGFARFKFKGRGLLFGLVILTLIVPPQTMIIPLYTRFRFFLGSINLINTVYPMIILSATCLAIKNGLYIFMFRQFFRNLPKELEEAAYIDGNNPFQTFLKIIIPTSLTMLATVFVLSFCWQWTDTIYSSLFMSNLPLMVNKAGAVYDFTVPIVDAMLKNSSAVIAVLPLAVLYIFAQNLFVQGIERSGITG